MLLLKSGADFDLRNTEGEAAIHIAAREGLLFLAQSLCAYRCVVDMSNNEGWFPLHLATKNGHKVRQKVMVWVRMSRSLIDYHSTRDRIISHKINTNTQA